MSKLFNILCLLVIGTFPLNGFANSTEPVNAANRGEITKTAQTEPDIAGIISKQGNLKTLFMLLNLSGLKEELKEEGPFTVFAPSDEAFNALGEEKLEALLAPANIENLRAVLSLHIVPKKLESADIKAKSLEGEELTIKTEGGKVTVNGAAVSKADLKAGNGVVHIIDKVLIPSKNDLNEEMNRQPNLAEANDRARQQNEFERKRKLEKERRDAELERELDRLDSQKDIKRQQREFENPWNYN